MDLVAALDDGTAPGDPRLPAGCGRLCGDSRAGPRRRGTGGTRGPSPRKRFATTGASRAPRSRSPPRAGSSGWIGFGRVGEARARLTVRVGGGRGGGTGGGPPGGGRSAGTRGPGGLPLPLLTVRCRWARLSLAHALRRSAFCRRLVPPWSQRARCRWRRRGRQRLGIRQASRLHPAAIVPAGRHASQPTSGRPPRVLLVHGLCRTRACGTRSPAGSPWPATKPPQSTALARRERGARLRATTRGRPPPTWPRSRVHAGHLRCRAGRAVLGWECGAAGGRRASRGRRRARAGGRRLVQPVRHDFASWEAADKAPAAARHRRPAGRADARQCPGHHATPTGPKRMGRWTPRWPTSRSAAGRDGAPSPV